MEYTTPRRLLWACLWTKFRAIWRRKWGDGKMVRWCQVMSGDVRCPQEAGHFWNPICANSGHFEQHFAAEICTSELLCNVPAISWTSWKLVTGEAWLWSGEAVATSIHLERYHHFLSRESLGLTEPCYGISMIFRVCYVMLHDWTDTLNHLII